MERVLKNTKIEKAVTIVGGGLGGLELAFAVKERLERAALHEVTVIERGKILKYETDNLNKKLTKFLLAKKIRIIENSNILKFTIIKFFFRRNNITVTLQ